MLLIFRWPRGRRAAGRGHVYTLVAGDDHRPPARGFLPVCAHIQGVRRLRRRACLAVGVCAKSAFLPRGPRCARPGGRSGRGGRNRPPPPQLLLLRTRKAGRDAGAGPWPASGVTLAGSDPRSAVEGGWCRRVPAVPGPLLGPASHRTSGAGLDAVAAAPVGRCPFSRNPSRPFPRSRRERGPKPKTSGLDS